MSDKRLQKYYLRLATEGVLKALLWGLTIGFGALAILGALYWMMGWSSVWVCLVVWGVVSAGMTVALYYKTFKPTTKYIAHRVDNLGLHERILTMTELEGDESYIAKRQRQDALEALETVGPELLKIGVSARTIISSAVSAVVGIGLVIVAFLTSAGILRSGQEVIQGPADPVVKYTVTYTVKEGCVGEIQGEAVQEVVVGEKSTGVAAIAGEGWAFLRWTDGVENPYREDVVTENNKMYIAVFVEVVAGGLGDVNDGDPDDAPGETGAGQDTQPDKDAEQGDEAKGKYEEINQIVDGKTYYGDLYGEAYEEVMDELAGEAYDEDVKEIVGGYFDNIEKDKQQEENN